MTGVSVEVSFKMSLGFTYFMSFRLYKTYFTTSLPPNEGPKGTRDTLSVTRKG